MRSNAGNMINKTMMLQIIAIAVMLVATASAANNQTTSAPTANETTTKTWETTTVVTEPTTMWDEHDEMQSEIDELNQEVDELYDIVYENEAKANSSISQLEEDVEALEGRVAELESDFDDVQDQLEATRALSTCQEYYDLGIDDSGYYFIDPDGSDGPIIPMEVYCNMNALSGYAITEFSHNSEDRILVNGCEDPKCYKRNVNYNQTISGIRAVMALSETCRQFIKYECLDSMMFSYEEEASWTSYDGKEQFYWGGADPDSRMCACGKNGDCSGTSTTCNCDLNDQVWREDSGYLTAKDALPVSQLAFGDTEALDERGYHTLGTLECYGKSSGDGETCASLKASGNSSGYYYINPDPNSVEAFRVYCDMESYPGTGITEIHHNKESTAVVYGSSYGSTIDVSYNDVNMTQIVALIDASAECTQYISGTYWKARDGTQKTYWGGAKPDHDGYCACGEDGTCYNGYSYDCNCEYTGSTINIDHGDLIDKNALPVTAMHYGFYYTSSSYYGYYTLGPLKCF